MQYPIGQLVRVSVDGLRFIEARIKQRSGVTGKFVLAGPAQYLVETQQGHSRWVKAADIMPMDQIPPQGKD